MDKISKHFRSIPVMPNHRIIAESLQLSTNVEKGSEHNVTFSVEVL